MKKWIALLLAVMMCLSMAACSTEDVAQVADNSNAEISDEQLEALMEAYNVVAPLYNEAYDAAESNGWLADELTAAEIEAVNTTLGVISQALTEDLTMLDGSDFEALPAALLEMEEPLREMIERVSEPYAG